VNRQLIFATIMIVIGIVFGIVGVREPNSNFFIGSQVWLAGGVILSQLAPSKTDKE